MRKLCTVLDLAFGSFSFGLVACAAPPPAESPPAGISSSDGALPHIGLNGHDKLIDGEFTAAHAEVGLLSMNGSACTGTLIRPNVVMTAAHCVEFQSFDARSFGQFVISGGASFDMDGARSFAQDAGAADIALVHLSEAVPANVAQPARIAGQAPAAGTQAALYGYGCGDRNNLQDAHQGQKQRYGFNIGNQTFNLCPGDSGGPSLIEATGEVFQVNSAYNTVGGDDIFGDAVALSAQLNQLADTWSGGQPAPGAGAVPPDRNPQPAPGGPDDGAGQGPDDGAGQGQNEDPGAGGEGGDPNAGGGGECADADADGWCDDPNAGGGGECADADFDGWCDDPNAGGDPECWADADCGEGGACGAGVCSWEA